MHVSDLDGGVEAEKITVHGFRAHSSFYAVLPNAKEMGSPYVGTTYLALFLHELLYFKP